MTMENPSIKTFSDDPPIQEFKISVRPRWSVLGQPGDYGTFLNANDVVLVQ